MVKIGHAVRDENGKISGGKPGDQDKLEIRIQEWYVSGNGWDYLLVCTDKALADKAASIMEQICKNDKYGYSQAARWSGYSSAKALGVAKGSGDFDCSSLVLSCYIFAGLDIRPDGYTGNMRSKLMATGKFKSYKASKYVSSDKYAERGAIYLREGHHVCMSLENGSKKATTIKYFAKYTGKTTSIVDALNSLKETSTYAYRLQIANANGIKLYAGTAAQNTKLLSLLKEGKLIKP